MQNYYISYKNYLNQLNIFIAINPFLYWLLLTLAMIKHRLCLLVNTTGDTSGAGVAYYYNWTHLSFCRVSSTPSLVFSVMLCILSIFVFRFILFALVLSVFRLNDFCLPLWYLRILYLQFWKCDSWPHLKVIFSPNPKLHLNFLTYTYFRTTSVSDDEISLLVKQSNDFKASPCAVIHADELEILLVVILTLNDPDGYL